MSSRKSQKKGQRNKTGVNFVSLIANVGFRVEFTPIDTGEEKVRAMNCSFGYFKGVRPAFEKAVKIRHEFEMKTFGETNIDLAKMDDYWKLVQENYPPEKLKWL